MSQAVLMEKSISLGTNCHLFVCLFGFFLSKYILSRIFRAIQSIVCGTCFWKKVQNLDQPTRKCELLLPNQKPLDVLTERNESNI